MEDITNISTNLNIEKIINDIHNNKCILFLGPLMASTEHEGKTRSVWDVYCEHLANELKSTGIPSIHEVNYNPYFLNTKYSLYAGGRANLESKIRSIYADFINSSSPVYELLSKLPFNTIINLGSDRMMQNALTKSGYEFSDKFYNYKGPYQQHLEGLDDNLQLVYNLFGSILDISSQILTEDEQLIFLRNIVSGPKLPDNVLSRVKDPANDKSYLFLGFNFEEWPFRFLLDVLQIPKTKSSATPKSPDYNIAFMTKEFYEEKFGLKFIELTPEAFSKWLVKEYRQQHKVDEHKFGFIAFHDYDSEVFKELSIHLESSKLGRRIDFWSKNSLIASDNKEELITTRFDSSTVYIPLLSSRFLNDPVLSSQLNAMIEKKGSLIFPIIVSNCDYESDFPNLAYSSSLILPKNDEPLINSTSSVTAGDYISMIRKINSKIR